MSRQEKLVDLFLDLKDGQKHFICIPSFIIQIKGLLSTFSQFYQMITEQAMTVTKISTSVLVMYFQVV